MCGIEARREGGGSLRGHVGGRRGAAGEAHGGQQRGAQRGGQRGPRRRALRAHAQLAERVARVGVAARRVAPRHEVVVHERRHQPAVPTVKNDHFTLYQRTTRIYKECN